MSTTTVAQWVVHQLAAWGVQALYGVAGDAILPLLAALEEHPQIRFYSVIHEATAAFMASAQAKFSGELGVCVATSGPGVANLLNGLMDAKKDRAPVLALTGQVASYNLDTDYKQTVDENLLLAPAVGFSGLATTAQAVNDLLVKALRAAITQGRPAHLAFTKDVWSQPVDEPVRSPEPYLTTKPQSSPEVVTGVFPLLNEAERPAILAGRGISGLGPLLLDLATHWESGIALTMPAKGAVPGEHPLVLGGLGPGGSAASSKMLAEADLLLIAGATWWPELYLPEQLKIVQLDTAVENIGGKIPVTYGIAGDLRLLLPRLREGIAKKEKPHWQQRLAELKTNWREKITPEREVEGTPVPPGRVILALERTIREDAVICLDVGDHTVWFNRLFNGSRQKVLLSGNWRSMGFGLPAALSAKIAHPDRQVIALVGDGGLAQSLADFVTAVRYHLPLTVIVLKNEWLAMERDRMELLAMDTWVTRLVTPDFATFAKACGGKGFTVHHSYQLEEILGQALNSLEPSIVQVQTAAPVFPGLVSQLSREKQEQKRSVALWV
ncbi:MAG TPA: thiamine pyrophosphate-binding protein [Firmicutes bacterium]|nr:thiamine pyrophosphate-binding protein [Bacillota bacterium]